MLYPLSYEGRLGARPKAGSERSGRSLSGARDRRAPRASPACRCPTTGASNAEPNDRGEHLEALQGEVDRDELTDDLVVVDHQHAPESLYHPREVTRSPPAHAG